MTTVKFAFKIVHESDFKNIFMLKRTKKIKFQIIVISLSAVGFVWFENQN